MSTYPEEFKDQVVSLHRAGRGFMDLGKEFNISPTTISNWVRAADKRDAPKRSGAVPVGQNGSEEADAAKIRRLEKQLAAKEEELQILGKALAFFARRMDQ